MNQDYALYWGDTHHNTYQHYRQDPSLDAVLTYAARHLDFYTGAYYTQVFHEARLRPELVPQPTKAAGGHPMEVIAATGIHWSGVRLERPKDPQKLAAEWAEFQTVTAAWNRPGEFVAFPGYEWQGNGRWGDFNVTYLDEGRPCFMVETLPELYALLRNHDAIAVPHHTAYHVGRRAPDWATVDPAVSPYAEVYSIHGCSETDEDWVGLRNNGHMGPGVAGGTYQEALDRGLRLGAICSTDNWANMPGQWNQGLMACLATDLSRPALWEAFKSRRVYGVTGDRIRLDFRCNGAHMGSVIPADGARELSVQVAGSAPLDRIELLRNGRVIAVHNHQGTWGMPTSSRSRYKVRIEMGWGAQRGEIPVPDHHWEGSVTVDGGRMLGWEPCWISRDQEAPVIDGNRAVFGAVSKQSHSDLPMQNALVFEFESAPDAQVHLYLNGREIVAPVAEFAARSHLLWYPETSRRLVAEMTDADMALAALTDVFYHMSPKAKIHPAVPAAGYTSTWTHVDADPLAGDSQYRVRVEQRNGQRAWSSPIWVEHH